MEDDIKFFRGALLKWFEENGRDFPWREDGISPYEVVVGEIMLQKTRAENTVDLYRRFIRKYPDPSALARTDLEEIREFVKPLGLHSRRSRTLKEAGELFAKTGTPRSREELESIHGVGKYIANAFLSVALGERRPIVDTNVRRVYSRFFSLNVKRDPRRDPGLWEFAERVLPEHDAKKLNLAVLDLGAMVCKEMDPKCHSCPVMERCKMTQQEGTPSSFQDAG